MAEKRSWTARNCLCVRRPKYPTETETKGIGAKISRVRTQSVSAMTVRTEREITAISAEYISPGPSSDRTCARSLVARAIRSPIR